MREIKKRSRIGNLSTAPPDSNGEIGVIKVHENVKKIELHIKHVKPAPRQ